MPPFARASVISLAPLGPLALLALVSACATGPVRQIEPSPPGSETIAILGTNDLHGAMVPLRFQSARHGSEASVPYEAGGIAMVASLVRALRQEWGGSLLWLDGGDAIHGSVESQADGGAGMIAALNANRLDAMALGEHDAREPQLQARMRDASFPVLSVNLRDSATGKPADLPGLLPSRILKAGGITVGVLGIAGATPPARRGHLAPVFSSGPAAEAVVEEARRLRERGAQAVVAAAHMGLRCAPGSSPTWQFIRKPTDPLGPCERSDELARLLHAIPEGTLDAVVAGRSHQLVHHWVRGVPVVQGGSAGLYANVIYLTVDREHGRVLPDRTRIEGPIPVCTRVFRNQKDCNGLREPPREGRGPLVPPELHGQDLVPDTATTALVQAAAQKAAPLRDEVIARASRPIEISRFQESALGNLAADAAKSAVGADFAYVNSGALRLSMPSGTIRYGDLFKSIPFDTRVVAVDLTGEELKLLARIAVNGSRGHANFSGLKLRVLGRRADTQATDLNGDRHIAPWEVNRLIGVELPGDDSLQPRKTYRLATLDFLAQGGDDLGWFFSRLSDSRFDRKIGPSLRDAVRAHLQALSRTGPVNSPAAPLVSSANPRYKFEKKKPKAARAKKKRSGKKRST